MAKKNTEGKKKIKILPIILIILGILLLAFAGFMLTLYLKARAMSKNAVPTLPTAIELPSVTAAPAELVEIDDPGYETVPNGNEIDPSLDEFVIGGRKFTDDSYLDQFSDIEIDRAIENYVNDPNDPDSWDMGAIDIDFGTDPIYYVPQINENIINILILGNDARNDRDHGRSDSMMLLSYNRATRKAKLVSFLRDTYIYIPGRDKWNRLNTAYRYGGVGLAINTLNVNFGLDIKYYIRVDFSAVKSLVNAVGGIDLELTVPEIQYINKCVPRTPIPLEAGVHHLNGAQVLYHSRNRRVGNYDWARAERQRKVMYALLERAKKEPNPVALMGLLYQLTDKLDTNMGVEQMVSLVVDVVFGGGFSMQNTALPFKGLWNYAWERGMAVIHLDIPANRAKLHEYLYGN